MKISIYTPTHTLRFVEQAYRSLLNQSVKRWEWILLLNGGVTQNDLPVSIRNDERVKIHYVPSVSGVGEAKALCLEHARGEYFLELDHDDLLLPYALEETLHAFETGACFVYSNTCRITEGIEPENTEYNLLHGWKYRPFEFDGKTFKECISFKPTPQAMSYIWYMPNHLRAFTRTLYEKAGGYDRGLKVCDDQDLMQRMYIQDPAFYHIDKPLYLQRIHNNQTQVVLNAEIQTKTRELYIKNINDIMLSWSKRNNLLALDMGGALRKKEGYLAVDRRKMPGVDFVCDCNKRLPFEDNSVGIIRAVDFMEHIKDSVHLMNEFYRILIHGGMLLSMTPSTDGRGAFQDPTHVSFWNENSFWYYTKANMRDFVPGIKARFQVSHIETSFPNKYCEQYDIPYVTANLSAVKEEDRLPGILEI
jgi:O-antigen biosynthesis protein